VSLQQLPGLVAEFRDMARDYLVQETIVPAKQLGHLSGFSLGAAAAWAVAIVLLAVAGMRTIVDVLPESPYWEALGYLLAVIALGVIAAIIVSVGPSSEDEAL
jgi:hypothetical protein